MDMVFYGPLDQCPICGGELECGRTKYYCTGAYSEWSTCSFNTQEPPRKDEELVMPDSIKESPAYDVNLLALIICCIFFSTFYLLRIMYFLSKFIALYSLLY